MCDTDKMHYNFLIWTSAYVESNIVIFSLQKWGHITYFHCVFCNYRIWNMAQNYTSHVIWFVYATIILLKKTIRYWKSKKKKGRLVLSLSYFYCCSRLTHYNQFSWIKYPNLKYVMYIAYFLLNIFCNIKKSLICD